MEKEKVYELHEYDTEFGKSYYDPNHRIMFGEGHLPIYKKLYGENIKIIKMPQTREVVLDNTTSVLPRAASLSSESFFRKLRSKRK